MITGYPAEIFHVRGRGLLKEGMKADITAFDPDSIADVGDYNNPARPPEGIKYVVVNGKMAVQNGIFQDARAGRALRMNQ